MVWKFFLGHQIYNCQLLAVVADLHVSLGCSYGYFFKCRFPVDCGSSTSPGVFIVLSFIGVRTCLVLQHAAKPHEILPPYTIPTWEGKIRLRPGLVYV